jgi:hypothetical protein
VPDEHLVKIAEVRRWPRRFELLGEWRKKPKSKLEPEPEPEPERVVLRIEAGETWEAFCERVERENALPESYVIAWDTLSATGGLYDASRVPIASLDTDFLSRSGSEGDGRPPPAKAWHRIRQKPLMTLADEMEFSEWLKLVSVRLAGVRQTRISLLARKYPYARFECLDGSTFDGLDHRNTRRAARVEATYQTLHGQY